MKQYVLIICLPGVTVCVFMLTGYKVLALLDVPVQPQERADVYLHITYIQKRDICAGNAIDQRHLAVTFDLFEGRGD